MTMLTLNYQSLLDQPSQAAFIAAIDQALGMDLAYWQSYYGVTLNAPTVDASIDDPHAALVALTYANPFQDPENEPLSYLRLDLGEYLECCQRYLTADHVTDATALCAWFQSALGLYFDPTGLTLGSVTPDPDRTDRSTITVTVADGNYVWFGTATLYVVAANHLALYAYPGTAKGLIWPDVM